MPENGFASIRRRLLMSTSNLCVRYKLVPTSAKIVFTKSKTNDVSDKSRYVWAIGSLKRRSYGSCFLVQRRRWSNRKHLLEFNLFNCWWAVPLTKVQNLHCYWRNWLALFCPHKKVHFPWCCRVHKDGNSLWPRETLCHLHRASSIFLILHEKFVILLHVPT